MLETRLQQSFFDCADLLYQVAEPLAKPLSDAAQAVIGCLTGGGKLLITGGPLAGHAAALLVRGFERDRPPLAALSVAAEPTSLRALGQPGDLLLLLDDGLLPSVGLELLEAAHDQDMAVIALAGAAPTWRPALTEADVLVPVPHERVARVRELHLVMLHALAEAIDFQLLGEQDPA